MIVTCLIYRRHVRISALIARQIYIRQPTNRLVSFIWNERCVYVRWPSIYVVACGFTRVTPRQRLKSPANRPFVQLFAHANNKKPHNYSLHKLCRLLNDGFSSPKTAVWTTFWCHSGFHQPQAGRGSYTKYVIYRNSVLIHHGPVLTKT